MLIKKKHEKLKSREMGLVLIDDLQHENRKQIVCNNINEITI